MSQFDVVVIGAGPGGYVAAIRSSQLGLKTALIEKSSTLGGTCLNVGCIPSKALLDSTEHYYNAKNHFATHGINVSGLSLNWDNMKKRKDEVVSQTCDGVMYLMNKNQIEVYQGHGSFLDANTIQVHKADGGTENIQTKTPSLPLVLSLLHCPMCQSTVNVLSPLLRRCPCPASRKLCS
jgi:dihydrolipoamide dehydrogenase